MSAFADLHRPGDPLRAPERLGPRVGRRARRGRASPAIGTTSLGVAAALGLRDGAAETARGDDRPRAPPHPPPRAGHDRHRERLLDRPGRGRGLRRPARPGRGRQPRGPARRPAPTSPQVLAAVSRATRSSSTPASTPTGSGDGGVDATLERADAYVARRRGRHLRPRRQGRGRDRRAGRGARRSRSTCSSSRACTVPRLAELGVARISTGSLLYRVALGAAHRRGAAASATDAASSTPRPTRRSTRSPTQTDREDELAAHVARPRAARGRRRRRSSGKVAAMCGRRPPSWTSGVMCSPRS